MISNMRAGWSNWGDWEKQVCCCEGVGGLRKRPVKGESIRAINLGGVLALMSDHNSCP